MQKHMCGADAGNDIQGLSVRCPSQIEEIVPTLDDDLLYGFVKLRYRGLQKNATQLSRCARW